MNPCSFMNCYSFSLGQTKSPFISPLKWQKKDVGMIYSFRILVEIHSKEKCFLSSSKYRTNEVWNRFKQHNKLCRYNTYGSRVAGVYAAPRFVTYKDLYIKVQRSEIIADSELFIPTVRLYSGHHFVKFDQADARQCSREEIKITMKSFEELLQGIESISKEQFEELLTNDVEMETNELPPFEEEDLPQKESTHKKDVEEMYPSGGGQYFLFI